MTTGSLKLSWIWFYSTSITFTLDENKKQDGDSVCGADDSVSG